SPAAVFMHHIAFKDKSHGFKTAVWMRPKGQTMILWGILLPPMMIQKNKRIKFIHRHHTCGHSAISNQVAHGFEFCFMFCFYCFHISYSMYKFPELLFTYILKFIKSSL